MLKSQCHITVTKFCVTKKNPSLRNTNLMKLHSILLYDCSSSVSKLYPVDQIWPLTCFFGQQNFTEIQTYSFISASVCFCSTKAELYS